MKGFFIVTLILLASLFTAVFAEDPDYGSTWETAELITPDSTLYVGVLGEGDQDWFYFPQTGNNRYRFTITNPQSGYKVMKVYLLDEFNILKEMVSLSAWTNTLQSQPFFEYDYDVYIQVYNTAGDYSIRADYLGNTPPDMYMNSCVDTADEIIPTTDPLNPIAPTVGTLDHLDPDEYDTDWFYFQTQPLHKYRIYKTHASNSNVWFRLYSDACGQLSGNTSDFTLIPWYGDDYRLLLEGDVNRYGNYYTVEIIDLESYTDDHGNTYDAATAYEPDVTGELFANIDYEANLGSDLDWFTFTPTANTLYRFTNKHLAGGYITMRVYQENEFGERIEQCSVSAWNEVRQLTAFFEYARPCYVRFEGVVDEYSLTIETVETLTDSYSNDCEFASELLVGELVGGTLVHDSPYDVDWFVFQTQPLHKYRIYKTHASNSNVWFRVFSDDCQQLSGNTSDFTIIPWYGEDIKVYLEGDGNRLGNYYTIEVTDLESYTDDWPNTWDAAAEMPKDGTEVDVFFEYDANIGTDEDWFTFIAGQDGVYHFMLGNPEGGYDTMRIYRVNEIQQLIEVTNQNAWNQVREFDVTLTAGVHYIKMMGSGGCTISLVSPEPRCGDLDHPYPMSDANRDCVVDLLDVAVMAAEWLTDTNP
ncbi:hypothetical protein SMSP2_02318 [Limihaloglobus sulfuriphilus]|uniref:Uncharacterized protein n=1 Tax=Limihaloglobus sulfuriphilus TaxID=1851148 RepID=A0A1Q2MH10_9BACT|nr:hypothetical protein [Limihaloglobus sulfuriphilus]AQQ71939.1 hypothetical protein SMSP2_02318 [Limihaloglobus sulfuriphilus]